jgi:hypothetical protein
MSTKEQEEFLIRHVFSPSEILSLLTQLRAEYPLPRSLSERYHFEAFSEYELALSDLG